MEHDRCISNEQLQPAMSEFLQTVGRGGAALFIHVNKAGNQDAESDVKGENCRYDKRMFVPRIQLKLCLCRRS